MKPEAIPFDAFEWHTVTFPVENADVLVPHDLHPAHPDDISYLVLDRDNDGVVYDARTLPNGQAWDPGYVVLRSTRAPATVRLLLLVRTVDHRGTR